MGHVIGGGEPAAAGNLVAGIEKIGVLDLSRLVFLIKTGAVRDESKAVIGASVSHLSREENIFSNEVDVVFSRSTFEGAADKCESLGGIVKCSAGLGNQRIIGEEFQARLNGVVEVTRIAGFRVVL